MIIGAFLEQRVTSGGGYQQSLNALLQVQKLVAGKAELVVFTGLRENLPTLASMGLRGVYLRIGLLDRLLYAATMSPIFTLLQRRLRLMSPFESKLLRHGVQLLYLVSPSWHPLVLQRLNYLFTLWDLCHRDFPEFPEVRDFGEFEMRESLFRKALPKAVLVIVDSADLAKRVCRRYGIDRERVLSMPFQPAPGITNVAGDGADVLERYVLTPGYLLYPAQFWSHKNHAALLMAFAQLPAEIRGRLDIVLTGGDKGRLPNVIRLAENLGIRDRVRALGFVSTAELAALYAHAGALVMPTYFGPTNIPPLEAWSFGVPVVYPRHLEEQVGDAAVLFDVDDPATLAAAIQQALNPATREHLAARGRERLACLRAERDAAERSLADVLRRFAQRSLSFEAGPRQA